MGINDKKIRKKKQCFRLVKFSKYHETAGNSFDPFFGFEDGEIHENFGDVFVRFGEDLVRGFWIFWRENSENVLLLLREIEK